MCLEPAIRVTVRAPGLGSEDFHDLVARAGLRGENHAVGWTAWLDIAPEGTSKASGLETVRHRVGVPPAATIAGGGAQISSEMLTWGESGVEVRDADERA